MSKGPPLDTEHHGQLDERLVVNSVVFGRRVIALSLDHMNDMGRSRLVTLTVNALDFTTQASTPSGIE